MLTPTTESFTLTIIKAEPRIDSRLMAKNLRNQHKAAMALIERYADQFKAFGQLPFKKEVGDRAQGGGNPERFALLNEDQAFFLLAYRAVKCCDRIRATPEMGPVRKNIVIESAGNLPDSEVFSRPNFAKAGIPALHVFGRDGLVRKAGRMADSMFLTSRPPDARKNANGGLQSQSGAEFMTTVNTTTPKMGLLTLGTTPATSPAPLARRLAIETALSAALHLVRTTDTQHGIQLATGRAARAASMLKQACAESTTSRRA